MLAHAIAISAALDRTLVLPPFVWMASQVHLHHHNNKDIDNIRVATVAGRRAALVCYVALLRTLRSPPLRARRRDGHVRAGCRQCVWRATAARASVPAVLRCPGASSCRGRAVHRRIFPAIQPAIRRTPADVSIRRGYPGKLRSRRCAVRARRRCHLEHTPRPFTTQEQSACGDNFHSNIRPQRRRARILALRAPPPRPSAARARHARPLSDQRRRQRRRRCWCRRRYP